MIVIRFIWTKLFSLLVSLLLLLALSSSLAVIFELWAVCLFVFSTSSPTDLFFFAALSLHRLSFDVLQLRWYAGSSRHSLASAHAFIFHSTRRGGLWMWTLTLSFTRLAIRPALDYGLDPWEKWCDVKWSEIWEFLSCCNDFDAWRNNRVSKAATLRQKRSLLQQQICSSSHIRDFFSIHVLLATLCRRKKIYLNELKMIYAFQFRGIYEFFSFFLLLLLLLTLLRVSCSSSTLWRFRLFFIFFLFEYIKTFSSLLRRTWVSNFVCSFVVAWLPRSWRFLSSLGVLCLQFFNLKISYSRWLK